MQITVYVDFARRGVTTGFLVAMRANDPRDKWRDRKEMELVSGVKGKRLFRLIR